MRPLRYNTAVDSSKRLTQAEEAYKRSQLRVQELKSSVAGLKAMIKASKQHRRTASTFSYTSTSTGDAMSPRSFHVDLPGEGEELGDIPMGPTSTTTATTPSHGPALAQRVAEGPEPQAEPEPEPEPAPSRRRSKRWSIGLPISVTSTMSTLSNLVPLPTFGMGRSSPTPSGTASGSGSYSSAPANQTFSKTADQTDQTSDIALVSLKEDYDRRAIKAYQADLYACERKLSLAVAEMYAAEQFVKDAQRQFQRNVRVSPSQLVGVERRIKV